MFQSTRPQGARLRSNRYQISRRISFNPRPRRGRDGCGERLGDSNATVSIHAPAGGATNGERIISKCLGLFQSTRPQGARLNGIRAHGNCTIVSIHAPAGGATHCKLTILETIKCFNPRARRGRDSTSLFLISTGVSFQSTRPQGARPRKNSSLGILSDMFQSTRPQGARPRLRPRNS